MLKRWLMFTLLATLVLGGSQHYDEVRVWLNHPADLEVLQRTGIDLEGARIKEGTFVDVILSESEQERVQLAGFYQETLREDMAAFYRSRLTRDPSREFGYGSMGGYYTFDEAIANVDSLQAAYPDIVSVKDSIGASLQDRPIWAFKISDNAATDEAEPEVFYNSLIHAREPGSLMTILYYAWYLAEHYGSDSLVTYLVDNREIWFVPVVNPDGYVQNEIMDPLGGGMHRKNMRPVCPSDPGVDLNRNWGHMWGFDNVGSSNDPCAPTYRGTEAFSEPETQVLRDFTMAHDFVTVFNCHTHGRLLIRPFGYDESVALPQPDSSAYVTLGHDLVRENNYLFGTGTETVNYTTNGDAVDYMYGELGIINFTPEIGSSFWPPSDDILPMVEENIPMNLRLSRVAGDAPELLEPRVESMADSAGNTIWNLVIRVQNKGLEMPGERPEYGVWLYSPDSSVTLPEPASTGYQAPPDPQAVSEWPMAIDLNVPDGEVATLVQELKVRKDLRTYALVDTIRWRVGVADTLFSEDFESGLSSWSSTGWGLTADGYAGTQGVTDSPNGEYGNDQETYLYLNQALDLSAHTDVHLSFRAKWSIETNWDFAQVQASCDDGATWVSLAGQYTVAGNGFSVQPEGEPGYHGFQHWVTEEMDLGSFEGCEQLRLRFRLVSDEYVTEDGFTLDDLVVQGWALPPAYLPGDLNGDNTVDILDLTAAIEWIIDPELQMADQIHIVDLNEDQALDIRDIIMILESILAPER